MDLIRLGAIKQTLNLVVKHSTGCPSFQTKFETEKTIIPTPNAKISNLNVLSYHIFIENI